MTQHITPPDDHDDHFVAKIPTFDGPISPTPAGEDIPRGEFEFVEYCVDCDEEVGQ